MIPRNLSPVFFLAACFWFLQPFSAGGQIMNAQQAADAGIDNESCFACHSDPDTAPLVDQTRFEKSVHSNHMCISCHADITETPHDTPLKPVVCSTCHRIETELYLNSDHGKALGRGVTEAATCKTCHNDAHTIMNSRNPESSVYRANISNTCGSCHANVQEISRFNLHQQMPVTSYENSVHGLAQKRGVLTAAACTDCHGSHSLLRSTNPESKLYWQNVPQTCGRCHENILSTYQQSIHGQQVAAGNRDAPICTDCHGEHSIDAIKKKTSKVYSSHISDTCGQCHAAERIISRYRLPRHVVDTYMGSYHGLAVQMGSLTAANCASCHGFHDILPRTDPRSAIHPDNLPKTCGKCHAGMGPQMASSQIHSGTQPGLEHKISLLVRMFYIILILLVISGMLIHNGLDFLKKLRIHYQENIHHKKIRMTRNERIQHAFLAVSFILLAYTGFALKYPQSWWASPFMGRVDWRSFGHRISAGVFCVLAVYHLYYIIFTPKGRKHIQALFLNWNDFVQMKDMFLYYIGRRPAKPVFGFYGYVEKIEYWALIWGSMVMIVTGSMMLKETWLLSSFPKWFYDVITAIHYYEAILACLAILIWHGYFVMFDPDEYPMKWTWITGHGSETDEERKHE